MSISSYAEAAVAVFAPELFAGHHVLVTGGTSGIGAAIAQGFVALGATVTATGATTGEVEAAAQIESVAYAELDVRDDPGVRALVERHERLDVVVNCAGVIRRGDELDPEVFASVVDINLTGSMRVCAAARSRLAESSGSIVNTASMLSFFGGGLVPGYAASKGGVAQLTKSLAIAYAAEGIRVNAVAPGWIETRLTSALQNDPARHKAISDRTALKRWGTPEDVVAAALFLASPGAAYITGVILPVDGGYLVV
ncbi:SDR family NAD(P)-dependent oxidoreductase [Lichenifustis flavocetrariae]|uniref:SDR family oxidoreductase n=1 Tax=Lichenifustis flavocetrariae TaxID=2949735 RepID=A0AA41YUV4_9HYPH|nr:SDR family oxidoreductase [Lichenifustis flavocetrariae]MCW6508991.1 SDR family oxidoreductase [Lichenifustis flavocetrariae]